MAVVQIILGVVGVYGMAGVAFGVAFAFRGAARLDPIATSGPITFRLLLVPGAAALWPWLLLRWARAGRRS